jgi:hypothetical protein
MECLWLVHACIFICVLLFSGDRIEWRVYRGGRSLWVPGRRRPGTSQPRQAIYTWYISDPIYLHCMFHKDLLNCMFLYCYSPCSNYLLAQAPQANLLSSFEMIPLWTPIQYPCNSSLLISSKAFGKLLVEPKTLGWEHSKKSFENLGVVSTPLNYFQNGLDKCSWSWRKREWWI